ncbi:MAG: DNA/RNA non-specific endonuclease [Ginsengibacter sp.]
MKKMYLAILLAMVFSVGYSQPILEKIKTVENEIKVTDQQRKLLFNELQQLKLNKIDYDLDELGLPTVFPNEQLVKHAAFYLDYAEKYEVARWVAHIILPDVMLGTVTRTNDFRVDSSITSGSSVEADYYLKKMNADSTFTYDGFGYDRGHLAPSADFRWSQTALSESYFYSNMTPQLPVFNREGWGELEDAIRGYLYRNPGTQLYVVTGPVLNDSLQKIERGVNKVSIPKFFWKIALDLKNQRAIGFIMPNAEITKPLQSFAVPISEVEQKTGLQFFTKLTPSVRQTIIEQKNIRDWLPEKNFADAEVMNQELLPRNIFNTEVAKNYINYNNDISVVGTVVGARVSKAGNILLNLDRQFPKQIFTVFIKKEKIANFSYSPDKELIGKVILVTGKVVGLDGVPAMFIDKEDALKLYPPTK